MMHKTSQKNDRRVKRTEKLIFDALIQCTTQKGFAATTVSDITEAAGINRATFYRHYTDKFSLLNQYAKHIYEKLRTKNDETNKKTDHSVPVSLVNILEHIRENALFYRVMLGKNGDQDFSENIRTFIRKRIYHSLPANLQIDKKKIDLFVTYSANASFGAVLWWLEHDMPYSSQEMLNTINNLEKVNLHSLFN